MYTRFSPLDEAHLAWALEYYDDRCRRDGGRMPPNLRLFADALKTPKGQKGPNSPEPDLIPDNSVVFYDYEAAGKVLSLSLTTVKRLVRAGELRAVHMGTKTRRIHRDDLVEYAERLRQKEMKNAEKPD